MQVPQGALGVVTAAVTPAVLISATAILISGVNARQASLADRLRALAAEYRDPQTQPQRKIAILRQAQLFRRRLHWASLADTGLYLAAACFTAMVLVLLVTPLHRTWETVIVPLLLIGMLLVFLGLAIELLEVGYAGRTTEMEIADAFAHPPSSAADADRAVR